MPETIRRKNVTKRYKLLCYMQDTIPEWQRGQAPLYKKVWERYDRAFKKWDILENDSHYKNMPTTTIGYIQYLKRHKLPINSHAVGSIWFFFKEDVGKIETAIYNSVIGFIKSLAH